jgi:endoglucanase
MKLVALFLIIIILNSCSSPKSKEPFITSKKFEIKSGIGIAYWLSQRDRHDSSFVREIFITKNDICKIAEMGFDHVRLPVDEEQLWSENGVRIKNTFNLMDSCIAWCIRENLRVIIDLHLLRSHNFKATPPIWGDHLLQQNFIACWLDLSSALQKYSNSNVAYELLNEPHTHREPEKWNELMLQTLLAIRKKEPERTIVIGSDRYNSGTMFDELNVPANDTNLILSLHCYEPTLLTHYKIYWGGFNDFTGTIHYPGKALTENEYNMLPDKIKKNRVLSRDVGKYFDKNVIESVYFKEAIQKCKELNLPLYLGEYGVSKNVTTIDRMNWYKDILSILQKNGIASGVWNYKSDFFGFYNEEGIPDKDLINLFEVYNMKMKNTNE